MSARNAVMLLEQLWRKSAERLASRCHGLADEELLWEPVNGTWNLVPDAAHPGGWTYPYDFDPPHPHPVTSIITELRSRCSATFTGGLTPD